MNIEFAVISEASSAIVAAALVGLITAATQWIIANNQNKKTDNQSKDIDEAKRQSKVGAELGAINSEKLDIMKHQQNGAVLIQLETIAKLSWAVANADPNNYEKAEAARIAQEAVDRQKSQLEIVTRVYQGVKEKFAIKNIVEQKIPPKSA